MRYFAANGVDIDGMPMEEKLQLAVSKVLKMTNTVELTVKSLIQDRSNPKT